MTSELHGRGLQAKFDTAATQARASLFPPEVGHLRRNLQYICVLKPDEGVYTSRGGA